MEWREPKLRCLGLRSDQQGAPAKMLSEIPNKYIRIPKVKRPNLGFPELILRPKLQKGLMT